MSDFKLITELNETETRDLFMKNEYYCTLNLPKYINFEPLLKGVNEAIKDVPFQGMCKNINPRRFKYPKFISNVNYQIMMFKDSNIDWRKIEILNPVLYIVLVDLITEKENWEYIKKILTEEIENIYCASIPSTPSQESVRARSVKNWYDKFERDSIISSLVYKSMFKLDIANFYPSIYTHSIPWALHGKETSKEKFINGKKLLGDAIDEKIKNMTYGQTNGIPQGSVIMDLIAEIILKAIDKELSSKVVGIKYKIIRYRDDYKIFINSKKDGEKIVSELVNVLSSYGLKLNSKKTEYFEDIIIGSVKSEKLRVYNLLLEEELLKQALQINKFAIENQNSGQITKLLTEFYEELEDNSADEIKDKSLELISIIINIAKYNPGGFHVNAAIISKLLEYLDVGSKEIIIELLVNYFDNFNNKEYIDLWLQRIIKVKKREFKNPSALVKVVNKYEKIDSLWNFSWLKEEYLNQFKDICIIDEEYINSMSEIIKSDEFKLFINKYDCF